MPPETDRTAANPGPLYHKPRLMTPGPTDVPPAVLEEMARPIIHHRTKQFQAIYAELSQRLQRIFRTSQPVLSLAGSGTTAFEAAQISLAVPGSTVLAVAAGKFGERWEDIFRQYAPFLNLNVQVMAVPWGQAANPAAIEAFLKQNADTSLVTVVHSETSTATACDLRAIAAVVGKSRSLLLADSITGLGALPVEMDAWGVDVLVTGSQKALMLPPGLGFIALGPRALARLKDTPAGPCYNLDLRRWLKSHEKNDVPFTPPVSLIRGQRVALEMIETEGLENVWARTARLAAASRAAFTAMKLKLISASPSDSVTGAFYPDGTEGAIDDSKFRAAMRAKYRIEIAGGQDGRGANWKGRIFRISHMGYVDAGDTLATLAALETELIAAGCAIKPGSALAAAAPLLR